jgi:RiboL-PSP-HEPN
VSGRSEVASLKARLDATFARINRIGVDEFEVRADFARYLCVLVCGYLQRAVVELLLHYATTHADESVTRYVSWRLKGFQNPSVARIKETVGAFDKTWRPDLDQFIVDERLDAIGSVLAQRHLIAHGGPSDITYARMAEYYKHIQEVVEHLTDLIVPSGTPST